MTLRALALVAVAAVLTVPTAARAAGRLALFDFGLANTSMEPTRPDELARLAMLKEVAAAELAERGFAIVDTAPVAAEVAKVSALHDCNGCELDLARGLGAELAGVGWVQKVSNLILNLNFQVRDVATGTLVHAGSVDIRGNTDESWRRGVTYLINRRIFRDQQQPAPAKS
jgi:Protein of unknown function (DUF2380)